MISQPKPECFILEAGKYRGQITDSANIKNYCDLTPACSYEKDLQRQIKAIGGNWDRSKRLWYAPEEYVKRIGLAGRIVK